MKFQNDVNMLLVRAENVYNRKFQPIKVGKPITGLVAGSALPCGTVVQFNEEAAKNYPNIFWKTVVHEVAHAIDIQLHGHRRNGNKYVHHDAIFYEICKKLGDPDPGRTHEYELKPARKHREFLYTCGCLLESGIPKEHVVKTITHNRIQKGTRSYQCKSCKKTIKFVKQI